MKSWQESCTPRAFTSWRRRGLLFRRSYAWRGPLADLFYVLLACPAVAQVGSHERNQALAGQGGGSGTLCYSAAMLEPMSARQREEHSMEVAHCCAALPCSSNQPRMTLRLRRNVEAPVLTSARIKYATAPTPAVQLTSQHTAPFILM